MENKAETYEQMSGNMHRGGEKKEDGTGRDERGSKEKQEERKLEERK